MSFVVTGKRYLVVGATALVGLVVSGVASAAQGPPVSAVSQYVEQVPTSEGPAKVGAARSKRATLPEAARKALASSSPETSARLTKIATSPTYGAPPTRVEPSQAARPKPKPKSSPERGNVVRPKPPRAPGNLVRGEPAADRSSIRPSLDAVAVSVGAGSEARMVGLGAFLALTTAAMVAAATRRRRSRSFDEPRTR